MEPLIGIGIMILSAAIVCLYFWIGYKIAKTANLSTGWTYGIGYAWCGFLDDIIGLLEKLI